MLDARCPGSTLGDMQRASVPDVPARPLYPDQARRLRRIVARRDRAKTNADERFAAELRVLIDDGAEVKAIATALGVSRQTIYDWLRRAAP
jgi:DNA invertase Pin-like site-specific DNA recombinase